MRIAICALSAVLLSGCSWLGGINNVFGGQGGYAHQAQNSGQYGQVNYGARGARGAHNGAQGQYGQNFGGGFPQQPQYGAPTQVTGQYGTHAANAHQAYGNQKSRPVLRKPKLRGSLSLGVEKSFSGDLLQFGDNLPVPTSPQVNLNGSFGFVQPFGSSGSPNEDLIVESVLTARETIVNSPSISFDDVHSTPAKISAGLEYIVTPKTTVFANAGFTSAEGNEGGVVSVIGTVEGQLTFTGFVNNIPGPENEQDIALRNVKIGQFSYDFSDLERYDLEVGARHYFNPILRNTVGRSITPFVGAAVGAAHYNDLSFKTQTEILELHDFVVDNETTFGPVLNQNEPTTLYEAQWVPTGQLNAGLEWQATPSVGIAFETGLRFEGARDFRFTETEIVNGMAVESEAFAKGDSNISVPFTIRGSYNF